MQATQGEGSAAGPKLETTQGQRFVTEGLHVLDVGCADIRVKVEGDGATTVIFIADPPNVIDHYTALSHLLSYRVRVVTMEAPGFGLSPPRHTYRHTIHEQVEALMRLLIRLGPGPNVLAFSCVSAYAALRLAEEYPELVSKLVLIQAPSWDEEVKWVRRVGWNGMLSTRLVGSTIMALGKRKIARDWYAVALPDKIRADAFTATAMHAFDRGARFPLDAAFRGAFGGPEQHFRPVFVPTLVVWGSADRTHAKTDRRSILDHAPNAKFVEFDNAGHFPELEEPERFRQELFRFLGSQTL